MRRDAAHLLDLGRSEDIVRPARTWLRLLQHDDSEEAGLAAKLYDQLVRPIEPVLRGCAKLWIAPQGTLSLVPFAALARRGEGGTERLVERLELAYLPSATVWLALDEAGLTPGERLVALGDPVYPGEDPEAVRGVVGRELSLRGLRSLPRLPGSGDEVRALAELFGAARSAVLTRARATATELTRALAGPRLLALHLACHGHVDDARPRLSGLVLAGGEVLTLDDIARLDVAADVVVLPVCDSGRGPVLVGEGIVGLVRAFFAAGARRVVVASWPIADQDARALMVRFHHALLCDGMSPPAALRAAQVEWLRAGGPAAHPSRWAAFAAWGG